VLVPDSAHGTNPASVHAVGWKVVELKSKDGHLDLEVLKAALGPHVAAVMVTQPSTLGMFEPRLGKVALKRGLGAPVSRGVAGGAHHSAGNAA